MRIRVVHVITGLGVGGAERLLLSTLRHMPRDEFECHVVCLYNRGSVAQEIESLGIPVTNIEMRSVGDLAGVLRLRRVLKRLRPDILHTHLFRANLWGRLAGASLRIPAIVSSEHSLTRTHFEGRPRRRWLTALDTALARLSDAVIAVSASTRDLLAENGIPPQKIVLIPNAIDTSLYTNGDGGAVRRELRLEDAHVITVVGRLVPQKNHRLVLAAIPAVLDQVTDARLLIVGSGPLQQELEALTPLAARHAVKFIGTRSDIPEIMAASDLVVLCSSYEPFGIALLEAMAAGRPVVGTSVDGIPELIDEGVTGLLIPSDDPEALAEAVLRILTDPSLAASMGKAGRKKAASFDIRQSAALLCDLYRRLSGVGDTGSEH